MSDAAAARRADTVILGGGLSGLALADMLERSGKDYLLVEGRNRFGGRILSTGRDDVGYDLGPAWFWPGQPLMHGLVQRLGLTAFPQYAEGALVVQEDGGALTRYDGYAPMAGALRLAGGMQGLVDGLSATLAPDRLLLGHVAYGITRTTAGVRLDTSRGSIEAAQIVLALPPRLAAESIRFDPPFTSEQLQTMAQIPSWMAGHAKLVAVYDCPFWRDAGLSGSVMSRLGPLAEIHDASPMSAGLGALFGFLGVPAARRVGRTEALIKAARDQLAAVFGACAREPLQVHFQDWATESLTATVADHTPVGAHPAYGLPQILRNGWEGRIQFAGTEMATANGGLLEGALEAAQIRFDAISRLRQHS